MGTSLDTLNAGSITYKYVVAIEGYSKLLTTAAAAAAVTAWAGTDWAAALEGLFVELDNQGSAHPWEPFQGGGTCTLRIAPDAADTFGIDTHRKLAGAETYLAATVDRNDTTIAVKDTTAFAASGEAFIGTECFAYSAKAATTFTVSTRGKYAAFTTSSGARWAGHHRQGTAANRVSLDPIVSAQPRVWIGKWVAVYLHRDIGGVLDVKAQAQLVYAGKIDEIRDDASGLVVVQLKHVMDTLGEAMLGRDQWTANIIEGIYLRDGQLFGMIDFAGDPASPRTANNLTCVASGAAGSNQFNEGYYSLDQLCDVINKWFEGERAAARIYGVYSIASPVASNVGLRTKIYFKIVNGDPSTTVSWQIKMPSLVAALFGFTLENPQQLQTASTTIDAPPNRNSNTSWLYQSPAPPLRGVLSHLETSNNLLDARVGLFGEVGTFLGQFDLLPRANRPPFGDLGLDWGVFSFNDTNYMVAAKVGNELRYMMPAFGFTLPGDPSGASPWSGQPSTVMTVSFDQPSTIVVKQVAALDTTFSTLLKFFFYGSGTANFNHASLDTLSYGLGLGIPGSLLGSGFDASVDALPGADANILVLIDRPTRMSDIVSSDLILRWAFPRWKQGTLSFAAWSLETSTTPLLLTEATKATPLGTKSNERTVTTLSNEWLRDIVTLLYNRDALSKEDYLSSLTFEDASHVDDSGGEGRPLTIKARNTYGQYINTGQGIEQIAPKFLAQFTLFSRPVRKQTLSIGPALYEQVAPGDVVSVSDTFARDPTTGARGIAIVSALVVRARSNRGGAQPNNPRGLPAQGEVDVMYSPDGTRPGIYSYAALVDETVSGGGFSAGYNSGTLTLRCKTHGHSESSEARDASRFVNGDKILIIERDPAIPSSPLSWSRTVTGAPVNDDIVLNSALAAPAFAATKRYRIIYDTYSVQQTSQRTLAAQADTDGLIENLASPFQYTEARSSAAFTAYDPTIPAELVANACYGDGKPLDCGHEFALLHLGLLLYDYRTAHCAPVVLDEATAGAGTWSGYQLVAFWPVHLGYDPQFAFDRQISVAPMFRSTTGGSASVRVTVVREPPEDGPIPPGELTAVAIPLAASSQVFTTTTTTFAIPTATLVLDVKNVSGVAWVLVECTQVAEIWGLARFDEGPRT